MSQLEPTRIQVGWREAEHDEVHAAGMVKAGVAGHAFAGEAGLLGDALRAMVAGGARSMMSDRSGGRRWTRSSP